jgi:hypothetical protein
MSLNIRATFDTTMSKYPTVDTTMSKYPTVDTTGYYKPGEKHKYKELSCLFIVTTHVLCWVNGYLPDINS